jgi:hypothetical protein
MEVAFRKAGNRRYAVVVRASAIGAQTVNPAPGFDDNIPHDLVHYVVEAELKITSGVYGRAERGGGTFLPVEVCASARAQARQRRKQARRERSMTRDDQERDQQMERSERFAFLCDVAWRRRHGQRPDPARWQAPTALSAEERRLIERVVSRLDQLAPKWRALASDQELVFVWPSLEAQVRSGPSPVPH